MKKRTGHLFKRNGTYWLRYQIDGQRFAQSLKTTNKRDAQSEAERIMAPLAKADEVATIQAVQARLETAATVAEKLADEVNPPPAIRQGWSLYLSSESRPQSGPATMKQYEGHFARFARWLAGTHPEVVQLRDVTPTHAAAFVRYLEAELHLSGGRINKFITLLKSLFKHIETPAKITANPFAKIAPRRHLAQSKRPLTIEELKAIIEKADGEMKTLFMLGTFTGLRLGDAATLRWDEVDLARGIIRRIPMKTARSGTAVVIGLPKILSDHLALLVRRGPFVQPDTASLYERDVQALSRRIQAHLISCGIQTLKAGTGFEMKDGREVYTGKRAVVLAGYHSLRHSFVSLHAQAGTPQAILQKLAGHSNPMMTEHYTHLDEGSARQMVNALPATLTGTTTPTKREPLPAWAADRLNSMTAKNWKSIRDEILA